MFAALKGRERAPGAEPLPPGARRCYTATETPTSKHHLHLERSGLSWSARCYEAATSINTPRWATTTWWSIPHAGVLTLTPEHVRALCDRHSGIGADGVVFGPQHDAAGQMSLRIFNPDGSEAEKSGNGIRIFARYAFEAGYVTCEPFILATRGGPVTVRILDELAR